MAKKKRIIFVPGKNPKPEPELHQQLVSRCLVEGVRKHSASAAKQIAEQDAVWVCPWNHDFYGESVDFTDQLASVDELIRRQRATVKEKILARSWKLKLNKAIYNLGDRYPWLIDKLADDHVKAMMDGSNIYFYDQEGKATEARNKLLEILRHDPDTETLLIGHSMGSIVSYDTLYQMSIEDRERKDVSLFLTLGSPLGLRYTQERLLGYSDTDASQLPSNIKNWKNVSARGDLVSFDTTLADDFGLMVQEGMVDDIVDFGKGVYNWYKGPNGYNFHSSYSYLMGPIVANIIAEWWNK